MIILTGGAGFIGTNVLIGLNETGEDDVLIVDNINTTLKWQHLVGRSFRDYVHKDELWSWLGEQANPDIQAVIHLGACTDTTEQNFDYIVQNNIRYSQRLWILCAELRIPFIYASSAATYGDGEQGFSDDHSLLPHLCPINAYGFAKHMFDLWALRQTEAPLNWTGLKFFNVYGPYEDHKGRMASVIYHAFPQAKNDGRIRLFQSHRLDYADGEQKRDFIYVKDVVAIIQHFLNHSLCSGIFNVGTGHARTFNDLAAAIFHSLGKPVEIEYFDMPEKLRTRYQYFTEAENNKLLNIGYNIPFTSLDKGVEAVHPFL